MPDAQDLTGFQPVATPANAVPVARPLPTSPDHIQELRYVGYADPNMLGFWREGQVLAFRKHLQIPPQRCFKCNEPSVGKPIKRSLYWHHPAIYLSLLLGLLTYVIVALIVRKTAVVRIGLCEKHRRQHRIVIITTAVSLLAIVPLSIAAAYVPYGGTLLVLLGLFLFIFGLVFYLLAGQLVTVKQIDDDIVRIKGAGHEYLGGFQLAQP